MLRDPVSWAYSYYYFILQCDPKHCSHTEYRWAKELPIEEFYRHPRHRNLQSRMLAGILAASWLGSTRVAQQLFDYSQIAVRRLQLDYVCFGLKERFEDSIRLFEQRLDMRATGNDDHSTKTLMRPPDEEIDRKRAGRLRDLLRGDQRLYDWAVKNFDLQVGNTLQTAGR